MGAYPGSFGLGLDLPWSRKPEASEKERFEKGTDGVGMDRWYTQVCEGHRGRCRWKGSYGVRRAGESGDCGNKDPHDRWRDPPFVLCIVVVAEEGPKPHVVLRWIPNSFLSTSIQSSSVLLDAVHRIHCKLYCLLPSLLRHEPIHPATWHRLSPWRRCGPSRHGWTRLDHIATTDPRHHRCSPFRCPDRTRMETEGIGNETGFDTGRTRIEWERGW